MPLLENKYDNILLYVYDLIDFLLGLVPKILMTMLSTIFFLSQASYSFLKNEPKNCYDRKALNALALSKAIILGAHVKTQDAQKNIIDAMLQEIIPMVTYLSRIAGAITFGLGAIVMLTRLLPIPTLAGEYLMIIGGTWIYSVAYGSFLECIVKNRKNLIRYLNIDTQLHDRRTSIFRITIKQKNPSLSFTSSSKGLRSDSITSFPEGADTLRSSSINSTDPRRLPNNQEINSLFSAGVFAFHPPAAINPESEKQRNSINDNKIFSA